MQVTIGYDGSPKFTFTDDELRALAAEHVEDLTYEDLAAEVTDTLYIRMKSSQQDPAALFLDSHGKGEGLDFEDHMTSIMAAYS